MGALEFIGSNVERWSCVITEGDCHDPKLVFLSKGEAGGVLGSVGQTQMHLIETSQAHLLNQVSNEWEKYLFRTTSNWRRSSVPEEAGTCWWMGQSWIRQ